MVVDPGAVTAVEYPEAALAVVAAVGAVAVQTAPDAIG